MINRFKHLGDMQQHRDGEFVTYEDHAAEVALLNEQVLTLTRKGDDLLNERLRLIEKVESQSLYISSLEVERKAFEGIQEQTAENKKLNEQVRALAAENADLKHPGTYLPSKRETPATDAILNEVRAQAVEGFGNYCDGCYGKGEGTGRDATIYAARIRKGEQP